MSLVLLAGAAMPVFAQTSRGRYAPRAAQDRRYDYDRYDRRDGRWEDDRSVWEKSRDKITVAAGAGAGAAVGAAAGGKKGAIIGALLGAGGAALYTHGIRDREDDRDGRWRYERRR